MDYDCHEMECVIRVYPNIWGGAELDLFQRRRCQLHRIDRKVKHRKQGRG
jgi:hypothetical protein